MNGNRERLQTGLLVVIVLLLLGVGGLIVTLKKERTDAMETETKAGIGLIALFRTYRSSPIEPGAVPAGYVDAVDIQVDNCPPDPDGVCGYAFIVRGPSNWNTLGDKTFYVMTTAGGPGEFYGPFSGDLREIAADAQHVKSLTDVE